MVFSLLRKSNFLGVLNIGHWWLGFVADAIQSLPWHSSQSNFVAQLCSRDLFYTPGGSQTAPFSPVADRIPTQTPYYILPSSVECFVIQNYRNRTLVEIGLFKMSTIQLMIKWDAWKCCTHTTLRARLGVTDLDIEVSCWPRLNRWWVDHWGSRTNSTQCSCGTAPEIDSAREQLFRDSTPQVREITSVVCFVFFCYLAVCAIGVTYRDKDLREELLGLLLCVLLLCHTSGCIWGATTNHRNQDTPSQRPTIQPTAQIFSYAAHTSTTRQKMQDLADDEGGKKAEAQGEAI